MPQLGRGLVVGIACATVLLVGTAPRPAGAALPSGSGSGATCSGIGITVEAVQSPRFYIDLAKNFYSAYVGYRVENVAASTAVTKPWLRLENHSGVVAAASGEPGRVPLDTGGSYTLGSGVQDTAFFYLTASGISASASTHQVALYSGKPGVGGQPVCRETFSMLTTEDTIAANANKVTGMTGVPGNVDLGSTFSFTVSGDTGTLGAGPATDLGLIRFSPSTVANFPSSAFRMTGVSFTLGGVTTTQRLALNNQVNGGVYTVTYTYQAVGPTSVATTILPVQYIASGTQIKHTGSFTGTTAIPAVTSQLSMTGSATTGGPTVPVTASAVNAGTTPVEVDDIQVTLPGGGWTYELGSATACGAAADDPVVVGSVLTFVGPFAVPAGGTCDLDLEVSGGTAGTAQVVAHVAETQVDSTISMTDNAPVLVNLGTGPAAPVALDDAATIPMTAAADVDVLANDSFSGAPVDPTQATVTILTPPTNGTASVVAGGGVRYTPGTGFSGSDSLEYEVTVAGESDTGTLSITVQPAPVAADDSGAVVQGGSVAISVLGNDTVGGVAITPGTATVTVSTTPANGTAVVNAGQQVVYEPAVGFVGTDTFDYDVVVAGQAATGTVTVTVSPATPIAADDADSVEQGASVDVDVIANDTVAGQALVAGSSTISIATPPARGSASVVGGKVRYAPAAGALGPDTFTYSVTVNGETATGTITVTVTPAAPVAVDDGATVTQGATTDVDVLVNDTVDGLAVPAGASLAIVTPPANGNASIVAGDVRYVPSVAFVGTDTLAYEVTVNGRSDTALVTISVQPASPVAGSDAAGVAQGASVDIDVLVNDTVAGLPVLPAGATVAVATQPAAGTATVVGTRIRYASPAAHVGASSFTYTVTVAGLSATGTVVVTSTPVEPVAGDDAATTPQGVAVLVAVLPNDSVAGLPVASSSASVAIAAAPAHGSASVQSDGSIRYAPGAAFSGTDELAYDVTVNGRTDRAVVRVTVLPAPTAAAEGARTVFGNSVLIDVLGNDVTGGLPASFAILVQPTHGSVAIVDGRIVYTPEPGYAGRDTFQYVLVTAGGSSVGTVELDVAPVQPSPPRNVTTTTSAAGRLTIAWTPPVSDGGSAISGYVVRDVTGRVVCIVAADATSCSVAGAGAFRGPYEVAARNGVGASADVVTRPARRGEGPPRRVETLAGNGVVLVGWELPLRHDGLVGYEVLVDGVVRCRTRELHCTVPASNGARHAIVVRAVYPSRQLPARGVVRSAAPRRGGTLQLVAYFGFDSSALRSGDRWRIERFGRLARKVGVTRMVLTGNTDSVGSHAYNVALSARRAITVQHAVQRQLPGVRLTIRWASEDRPVAPNGSGTGRQQNRRVNATLIS